MAQWQKGIAVGCIGMSVDDFCKCDFDEFEAICRAWQEMTDAHYRNLWERMRTLASITIQPHIRKKITPKQLIPLPWDNKNVYVQNAMTGLSPDEKLRRFKYLTEHLIH